MPLKDSHDRPRGQLFQEALSKSTKPASSSRAPSFVATDKADRLVAWPLIPLLQQQNPERKPLAFSEPGPCKLPQAWISRNLPKPQTHRQLCLQKPFHIRSASSRDSLECIGSCCIEIAAPWMLWLGNSAWSRPERMPCASIPDTTRAWTTAFRSGQPCLLP